MMAIGLVLASCTKTDIAKDTPRCIKSEIRDFSKQVPCDDATVGEFTFQGETVYLFFPGTCGADMASDVISSDCKNLGSLGGISGNTKINGESFSNAQFIRTVWEK